MSVEELIELAKALTADEQLQLLRAVEKDRFTKLERQFAEMIPPGTVLEVWSPQVTGIDLEIVEQELRKFRERQ